MTRNTLIDLKNPNKMQTSINLGRKIIFLILFIQCDLQGHLMSKVKVPNESQIMTSYLKLILNVYSKTPPIRPPLGPVQMVGLAGWSD